MKHEFNSPWLLVATPQLVDSNFHETVVLVVEHTPTWSKGFVLNRPLPTPLAMALTGHTQQIPSHIPIWAGGPVDRESGIILCDASGSRLAPDTLELSLLTSDEALADLVEHATSSLAAQTNGMSPTPLYRHRFLSGYAGWHEGQLEDELRHGAWIQVPATWDLVFNTDWRVLWDKAFAGITPVGSSAWASASALPRYLN